MSELIALGVGVVAGIGIGVHLCCIIENLFNNENKDNEDNDNE